MRGDRPDDLTELLVSDPFEVVFGELMVKFESFVGDSLHCLVDKL